MRVRASLVPSTGQAFPDLSIASLPCASSCPSRLVGVICTLPFVALSDINAQGLVSESQVRMDPKGSRQSWIVRLRLPVSCAVTAGDGAVHRNTWPTLPTPMLCELTTHNYLDVKIQNRCLN
ncbi:hypothetical protein HAX54_013463 [Datura stramonium]|uniref:Uncharacterized protein n=1 Tax=Datura stramonium TaxID=4076 RepID=A0ABS8TLA1_DATST|nr:hypothetical protein [Datura stramonium]